MEPIARNTELQQSEISRPSTLLKLPTLGHQRSLQDLIEDSFGSQNDGSLAMAASLGQRDEEPDFDGANIETPTSDTQEERPQTPADSASAKRRDQDHQMTDLHDNTIIAHESLWSRIFKRYDCNM